jgi:hypothetical protein
MRPSSPPQVPEDALLRDEKLVGRAYSIARTRPLGQATHSDFSSSRGFDSLGTVAPTSSPIDHAQCFIMPTYQCNILQIAEQSQPGDKHETPGFSKTWLFLVNTNVQSKSRKCHSLKWKTCSSSRRCPRTSSSPRTASWRWRREPPKRTATVCVSGAGPSGSSDA